MSILIFIIGACLGSFYLVIALRLPKGKDVIFSRSKCDNCNHELGFFELIPIFSYIFLLGKCKKCHKKINPLHILTELACGLGFVLSYKIFGISYEMYMFMILYSLMIIIFITDFSCYLILDSPLLVSGILIAILKICYFGLEKFLVSFICGIILFIVMYLIKLLGDFLFKRESLGGGDIKFAFIMGFALDFKLSLCALILSTFLALPYSLAALALKKNNEVAYGPFLAASLLLVFVFQEKFIELLNMIFISL